MKILEMKIGDLIPYENNPRKNDGAVEQVANSIKEFGFKVPIVIDSNNVIIAGHTRLKASIKLGLDTVPCIVADDLTEEQIKAFRVADNKVAELAEWDFEKLDEELAFLSLDMTEFGFDLDQVDKLKPVKEDGYNEPVPENPKSKLGDIYQLGNHRLMCGDSTSLSDVEKLMSGEVADLLITDPPYNVNYEGTAGKIENDNMEDSQFRQFLYDAFLNAKTVMKAGGAFYIWHADSEGYNFRGACVDCGLKIRQCLIWLKNSLVLGRQDYQWKHEPCLYGENPINGTDSVIYEDDTEPCLYGWVDGKHYWFRNRKQTTILQFDRPTVSKEHPTMKPIKLFDYQIKGNTKKVKMF